MIANIIFTLIGLFIMCIACWIMGYRTCASRSKNEFDRGYNAAMNDFDKDYVYVDRDEMLDNIYREEKGKQLLNEMEELFEDNVIDCGEY